MGTVLSVNIYREKSITPIFSAANLILILSIVFGALNECIELIILGILVFSIVSTVTLVDNFLKEYRNKTLQYMREKLVYKDILTSMKNRQSFEKQLKQDDENTLVDNFLKEYRNKTLQYMREKLVYKDILTSMKNRQSFEKQLKQDDENINDFNSY